MDIQIMGHEKEIVQSKCFANNAGCSHLCLIAPNKEGYVCACPIGIKLLVIVKNIKRKTLTCKFAEVISCFNYSFQDDSKTCAASPSTWLIVAHRQEIRQIALDVPYTVDVVLPFPLLHSTVAIDVDGLTGKQSTVDYKLKMFGIKQQRPDYFRGYLLVRHRRRCDTKSSTRWFRSGNYRGRSTGHR